MTSCPLFSSTFCMIIPCLLWGVLALIPAGHLLAQDKDEPTEFSAYAEMIVAPVRIAWRSAWSPDETWIATSYGVYQGNLGKLRVWDAKTGQVRWEVTEKRGIRRVVVSPDGTIVASGNYGGVIHLRNAATGRLLKTLEGADQTVHGLTFSSDGKRLVSCGGNHKLHVWDLTAGTLQLTIAGHTDATNGVQYSPDEKLLLSYSRDRSARIWNAEDGQALHLFKHPEQVFDGVFLQNSKQIATACADGLVRIFQVDSGELVTTLPQDVPLPKNSPRRVPVYALAVSSDGTLLATADTRIRIWNTASWENVSTLNSSGFMFGLNFSKDAKSLLSSNSEASVDIWDVPSQKQRLTFSLPAEIQAGAGEVRSLAISPNGNQLATVDGESQAHLRDRRTGKILRSLDANNTVNAVAFSPNGQTLASAGDSLCLWDVPKGVLITRLSDQVSANAIAWSPDGKLLATGGVNGNVCLWDITDKTQRATLAGHTGEVHSLAFMPDGSRLFSGSGDGTARVWDVEKQASLKTLDHTGAVLSVAISPNGSTLVTAGDDLAVQFWDAATMKLQAVKRAHKQPVVSLAFSPQGQTLASGASGGGIVLWDTSTTAQRKVLNGHGQGSLALSFLPDGSGLMSASSDQTIRFWKATPQRSQK